MSRTQLGARCRAEEQGEVKLERAHSAALRNRHFHLSGKHILLLTIVTGAETKRRGATAMVQQPPLPGRKRGQSLVTATHPRRAHSGLPRKLQDERQVTEHRIPT